MLLLNPKMGKHTNLKNQNEDDEEAADCDTSEVPTPMAPFLLESAELAETLPLADFLSLGWVSVPLSMWGLLAE